MFHYCLKKKELLGIRENSQGIRLGQSCNFFLHLFLLLETGIISMITTGIAEEKKRRRESLKSNSNLKLSGDTMLDLYPEETNTTHWNSNTT